MTTQRASALLFLLGTALHAQFDSASVLGSVRDASGALVPGVSVTLENTETRIAAYMGVGTHTMPGDVWWRTWRTLPTTNPPHPPSGCAIDTANFDWQGQYPPHGYYTTYNDPQSGRPFTVLEGHYVYTGTAT